MHVKDFFFKVCNENSIVQNKKEKNLPKLYLHSVQLELLANERVCI